MIKELSAVLLFASTLPLLGQTSADVRVAKRVCRAPGATIVNCIGGTDMATVPPGTVVFYELLLANFGPGAASAVTVTDMLPPGVIYQSVETSSSVTCTTPVPGAAAGTVTCTRALPAPPPGRVFVFLVRVYVLIAPAPDGTSIVNTATVTNPEPDPISTNNVDSATVIVAAVSVPTLSEWALILTTAALGLLGTLSLRR